MRYRHRRTGKLITVEPGSRHQRQLERHRAFEQVGNPPPAPGPDDESETEPVEESGETSEESEPEDAEEPTEESGPGPVDGIQHVGGGLFEVTHGGQTERVRGKEAAEARLAELADDDGGW